MRSATMVLGLVILWLPGSALAQVVAGQALPKFQAPPKGSHIGSIVIKTPSSELIGTAFGVSSDGYVATSFSIMRNAVSAKLVGEDGSSTPILSAVAVNKARDLVILATRVRNVAPNLRFDPKAELLLQSILLPQPGPLSQPLLDIVPSFRGFRGSFVYMPQLHAKASGEEFLRGLSNDGPVGLGTDPAVEWLMLDVAVDGSYAGAPVWDEKYGSVVGIVSGGGDGTPGLRFVLPIKYVLELVPQKPVPLIALSKLAKWEDPKLLPPAANAAKLATIDSAARWAKINARHTKLVADVAELQKLKDKFTGEATTAIAQVNQAEAQQKKMVPEIVTLERVPRKVETKVPQKKGPDKTVVETVYEIETIRKWSPKQQAELAILQQTIATHQPAKLVTKLHLSLIESNLLPHMQRRIGEATIELLLAADPLELRGIDELGPLQKKLEERIQQASQDPMEYLLRAVLLTRLRNGAAARLDLAEMVRLDAQYAPLRAVLERRLENFENKTQLPAPESKTHTELAGSLLPLLEARIEWDNGNGKTAAEILSKWLTKHQRHADVHTALAWEMLATNPLSVVTQQAALQYAWNAIELSRGGDWLALGALAAAQVRGKDYLAAQETLTYLLPLLPAEYQALGDAWQKSIADKDSLQRPVR